MSKTTATNSQLRSCLVTLLAPDQEAALPLHLGAVLACFESPDALSKADPQITHRLRVRLSSLLQSNLPLVRCAAADLVYVLVGKDWGSLDSHGSTWIRLLLSILEKRTDGFMTTSSTVMALSRIFALTSGKPTLTRELATPNIPAFITNLLNLSTINSDKIDVRMLKVTLPALFALVRDQSNMTRPFISKILSGIIYPIFNLSVQLHTPVEKTVELWARKLYVSLYLTAPKNSEEMWRASLVHTINETHKALSKTFRGVDEEKKYSDIPTGWEYSVEITDPFVGVLRIEMLLRVVETFLTTPTSSPVQVPVSKILHLIDRILSFGSVSTQFHVTVDRSQQDFITSVIPVIHANTYGLLATVVRTVGQSILPYETILLAHLLAVRPATNRRYHIPVYKFVEVLLLTTSLLPASFNPAIIHIVEVALDSISPSQNFSAKSVSDYASHPSTFTRKAPSDVVISALRMFCAVVTAVPDLPAATRSSIDRLALLRSEMDIEQERLLLLQVLNPGRNIRWSILPMAVRKLPVDPKMTSVYHPRFPPCPIRRDEILDNMVLTESGQPAQVETPKPKEIVIAASAPSNRLEVKPVGKPTVETFFKPTPQPLTSALKSSIAKPFIEKPPENKKPTPVQEATTPIRVSETTPRFSADNRSRKLPFVSRTSEAPKPATQKPVFQLFQSNTITPVNAEEPETIIPGTSASPRLAPDAATKSHSDTSSSSTTVMAKGSNLIAAGSNTTKPIAPPSSSTPSSSVLSQLFRKPVVDKGSSQHQQHSSIFRKSSETSALKPLRPLQFARKGSGTAPPEFKVSGLPRPGLNLPFESPKEQPSSSSPSARKTDEGHKTERSGLGPVLQIHRKQQQLEQQQQLVHTPLDEHKKSSKLHFSNGPSVGIEEIKIESLAPPIPKAVGLPMKGFPIRVPISTTPPVSVITPETLIAMAALSFVKVYDDSVETDDGDAPKAADAVAAVKPRTEGKAAGTMVVDSVAVDVKPVETKAVDIIAVNANAMISKACDAEIVDIAADERMALASKPVVTTDTAAATAGPAIKTSKRPLVVEKETAVVVAKKEKKQKVDEEVKERK
ncbi:rRNA processing/ribosome biogenesis-domain-containing protein [Limtongia smithiae]|uniref:rRNA processing/ribosome biogenesis-domain-containing protein n=1 Tax=Limtongia smithiae TaxID=1125753 RepID=UPI0034CDE906